VVRLLQARVRLPEDVALIDAGSPGIDLAPIVLGADALVLVDTVRLDAPAGTLHAFRKDAILAHGAPVPRVSPHESGIRHALWLADTLRQGPEEVLLIGAVPHDVELGGEMSAPVRGASERAVHLVLDELRRLGWRPEAIERPAPPDLWWERRPSTS
jgi:hydrogenase maturation protease